MILSVERAYSIFLKNPKNSDEKDKLSHEEYAVYSHLCRCGYIVQRFKLNDFNQLASKADQKSSSVKELCVWHYLHELLGQPKQTDLRQQPQIFDKVKRSMDNIIKSFREPANRNNLSLKRQKSSQEIVDKSKKFRSENLQSNDESFLLNFDSIEIIKIEANTTNELSHDDSLRISFDLWTDGTFKKSKSSPPNYRIVVLRFVYS